MLETIRLFVKITRSLSIMRRYFVVNGFDGALTMLGLTMGFRLTVEPNLSLAISACLGAAIALGVSGVTSAYISESAERAKELDDLERSMMADLSETAHGVAARLVPILIALVNGLAPMLISVLIILPLFLARAGIDLPWSPFDATLAMAFVILFLLGVFLGHVTDRFWLWAGIRALAIGAVTAGLIMVLVPQ